MRSGVEMKRKEVIIAGVGYCYLHRREYAFACGAIMFFVAVLYGSLELGFPVQNYRS